ncbi:3'-5' exoribonuclease [Halobacillus litoralis]|uniref:exonuclease domain-containing protein n=1 Tax=Halobacillus litoralis TaxID=45668 RepID=UPI001CD7E1C8|nr:exonuclease domain-containing protein [Halobacillus litoralis]MCA0968993.1 3'-5' exoribonuclease [Halobacillus litoralis]
MNFIALDFETANSSRSSVCSIGLVEYEDGKMKREYYRLVKPKQSYFAPINISIHGIRPEDVEDSYEFHELWEEEIKEIIEGKLVIAHNAQFDMSVLRAVLDQYNLPYPMIAFNCTVNISKKTWRLPKYNLKAVSDHLGIDLNHHQALDDARASARIFLEAAKEMKAATAKELVEKTQTSNGMMYENSYEPARKQARRRKKPSSVPYMAATQADTSHPFYGSSFVLTGRMKGLKREQAIERIQQKGGIVHTNVESTTNFVVMGETTYQDYLNGNKTIKIEQAEQLLAQGHSIELIDEKGFKNQLNEKG